MTIAIGITTFNRPAMLLDLLGDIKRDSSGFDLIVKIIDDGSYIPYSNVTEYCRRHGIYITKQGGRGKKGYYKTMQSLYNLIQPEQFDYFYFFPDDFRLAPDYFRRSIEYFNMIDDPKLIGLNTMNTERVNPAWTKFDPVDVVFNGVTFTQTQWLDCHVMARRDYFEALDWSVPSTRHWYAGSSGVGAMISKRLHGAGYSMYTCPNLIGHGDHDSVMHGAERKINPLVSVV